MGINISSSMNFKNQQFPKKSAKEAAKKNDAESNEAENFSERVYSANSKSVSFIETNLFKSLADVALNNSLNETLAYLKAQTYDKHKKYVLGELWEQFNQNKTEDEIFQGELIDFEVDNNLENIFAA